MFIKESAVHNRWGGTRRNILSSIIKVSLTGPRGLQVLCLGDDVRNRLSCNTLVMEAAIKSEAQLFT